MADLRAQLQEGLGASYALERELGRGGMATVFLARDLKHDRPVALKVLHPELAASLGPERFQREIRLAARLQHPHILTVLDSGGAAGRLWFTMPFVEGESLRDRLRRERQLPVEDALRVAREAAQALQYAHDHGVVHRDLKPENLLLTRDGSTLVADFGIARALGGSGDEHLTETGLAVGTPAYMSPEQAAGDRGLDSRTDIYSLAAVLYEMLAGEPPYVGATMQALMVKRLTEPPPGARAVRPNVPEGVDQAIRKALAPVAADRFGSMAQFAAALVAAPVSPTSAAPAVVTAPPELPRISPAPSAPARRRGIPIAGATLVLGILIGLGVLFAWRNHGDAAGGGSRVVAILPFENLGDSADAYFADGVTDEVRTKLAKVAGLDVIARGSSNEYRGTTKRAQEIAQELGAGYLLTGTVRWVKGGDGTNRVRVTPELVEVLPGRTPRTRWGEQFDAGITDVFQVQAEIAGKVVNALDVALADSVREELVARPTNSVAAYDAFLKGEARSARMSTQNPPDLHQAIGHYRQATALDSGFVPAWAQLSRAYAVLYRATVPSREVAEQARQAAEQARRLGPNRAEAFLALGDYQADVKKDDRQAFATYEAGLKLAPDNVELLTAMGQREQALNRWESAATRLGRAVTLDPRSVSAIRRYAYTLMLLRRFPEAEAAQERALRLAPTDLTLVEQGAMLALMQGDLERARRIAASRLAGVDPDEHIAYFATYEELAFVLSDEQLRRLVVLSPTPFAGDRGAWGMSLAQGYRLLGDSGKMRAYADSARLAFEEQLRDAPDDGQLHVLLGHALALAGRKAEAIRTGRRALSLLSPEKDAYFGPYIQHQLARIHLLVGEPDQALDQLEPLQRRPYTLTPGWMRVDPLFDPVRNHPRFRKLTGEAR